MENAELIQATLLALTRQNVIGQDEAGDLKGQIIYIYRGIVRDDDDRIVGVAQTL